MGYLRSTSTLPWVTTAPHLQPGSPDGRMPWGTRHVKAEGSSHTACGQPAAHWKLFRHLRFDPLGIDACRSCARAMVLDSPVVATARPSR